MNWLNFATKTASILATGTSLYDIHKLGVQSANIKRESNYADDFIAQTIGASKLNYPSEKHNKMKEWILSFKYPLQDSEVFNTVSGYIQGAIKGIGYNLGTLGFSALAFFAKKDSFKKVGIIGLGLSVAWDFIKNSTNLFEKTDYLRKNN